MKTLRSVHEYAALLEVERRARRLIGDLARAPAEDPMAAVDIVADSVDELLLALAAVDKAREEAGT